MSQITLHSDKWHKINYLLQLDKSYLRENLEQQSQVPFPLKTRPQMGPSTCPFVYVLQEVKFSRENNVKVNNSESTQRLFRRVF